MDNRQEGTGEAVSVLGLEMDKSVVLVLPLRLWDPTLGDHILVNLFLCIIGSPGKPGHLLQRSILAVGSLHLAVLIVHAHTTQSPYGQVDGEPLGGVPGDRRVFGYDVMFEPVLGSWNSSDMQCHQLGLGENESIARLCESAICPNLFEWRAPLSLDIHDVVGVGLKGPVYNYSLEIICF